MEKLIKTQFFIYFFHYKWSSEGEFIVYCINIAYTYVVSRNFLFERRLYFY